MFFLFLLLFFNNKTDKQNPYMTTEKPPEYFFRASLEISLKKGVCMYTHGEIIGKAINTNI